MKPRQKLSSLVCAALGDNPDVGLWVCIMPGYALPRQIPDYAGSLDAMNAAVMRLNNDQRRTFASHLADVVCGLAERDSSDDFYVINAAANYRAKALVMTLGQWKPEYEQFVK